MTIRVVLKSAASGETIGEGQHAAVPPIGSQIMFLHRDWTAYTVNAIRMWPRGDESPDLELIGQEPTPAMVEAFVSFAGELS